MAKFETLVTDARKFLSALAENNNREWWQENKATYEADLKAPALALLSELTKPLEKLTSENISSKLFRPHRDVRFSKDKTPYTTHLHMMWKVEAGAPQNPVFFFGIGRDYITIGAGMMGLEKPVLENWRQMVDLDTDRILGIMRDIEGAGFALREPALKRVPSAYDKDHRAGHLLRMKGVLASKSLPDDANLPKAIMEGCEAAWPLNNLMISIAEA